jgi:8-oxo-dGTP diphosphatase
MGIRDIDWQAWQPDLLTTLVFIRKDQEVLLIHKKTGLGRGKINGPGGKIELGETPLSCALRETQEELDIIPLNMMPRAELNFHAIDFPKIKAFVFVAYDYQGTPTESQEAAPLWCDISALPFDRMWDDDRYWLPKVLAGTSLTGWFSFMGEDLVDHQIQIGPVSF